MTTLTPTLYMPHGGGPCFFMDWNPPGMWDTMGDFLRRLPERAAHGGTGNEII